MTSNPFAFMTLIVLFIMLLNLTGQLCQLVNSPFLQQLTSSPLPLSSPSTSSLSTSSILSILSSSPSSSSSSSSSSSDSSTSPSSESSESSSPLPLLSYSSEVSGDSTKPFSDSLPLRQSINNKQQSSQFNNHPNPEGKQYQSARYLVKPFWLNPKYTWKIFQMNSSRNEAKDAEMRKRSKVRKLADKMKKAAIISKKLYLLLDEINMDFYTDLA